MEVTLKQIFGPWEQGWVLDKHTLKSVYLGHNGNRAMFDTTRSATGEATYLLKYQGRWDRVAPLAQALAEHVYPKLVDVGLIVPMPASTPRPRQPVTEIARALGELVNVPVYTQLLTKTPTGQSLKDLASKVEKMAALHEALSLNDNIDAEGPLNALLVDDLYDSGASMEVACTVLRTCPKVGRIYVAALTWK